MLVENQRRKTKHTKQQNQETNTETQPKIQTPPSEPPQPDPNLQAFYNEVMGNVFAWKNRQEDFKRFLNSCFPFTQPSQAQSNSTPPT